MAAFDWDTTSDANVNLLFLHHARENGEAEQRERAGIECKRVSGGWAECTAGSRRSCHRAAVAALSHHSLPQPSHAMRLTELSLSLSVPQTLRGKRALHVCWAASASSVSWEAFGYFVRFPHHRWFWGNHWKKVFFSWHFEIVKRKSGEWVVSNESWQHLV